MPFNPLALTGQVKTTSKVLFQGLLINDYTLLLSGRRKSKGKSGKAVKLLIIKGLEL